MARRRRLAALALAGALSLLPGCGTLADLVGNHHQRGPRPFGGIRNDIAFMQYDGKLSRVTSIFIPFAVLDMPLCLALDLALLPVSLPLAAWRSHLETERAIQRTRNAKGESNRR